MAMNTISVVACIILLLEIHHMGLRFKQSMLVSHTCPKMYLKCICKRSVLDTQQSRTVYSHNCNNFSNEVAQFLVGATIPEYILNLPNEVTSSPMAALILPMIERLETTMKAGAVPPAPQFKERILFTPKEPASTDHDIAPLSFGANTKEDESKLKSEEKPSKSGESQIQQKIVLFLQWSIPQ